MGDRASTSLIEKSTPENYIGYVPLPDRIRLLQVKAIEECTALLRTIDLHPTKGADGPRSMMDFTIYSKKIYEQCDAINARLKIEVDEISTANPINFLTHRNVTLSNDWYERFQDHYNYWFEYYGLQYIEIPNKNDIERLLDNSPMVKKVG
jgi:hypothetical protein